MLKQALLIAGALSLTTSAFALEVTNPFYGPEKGHVASTTSYDFETTTLKSNWGDLHTRTRDYNNSLTESLSYGVTDSVSIDASVSNTWQKQKDVIQYAHVPVGMHTDTDDKNVDFTIGSTWNVLTGPTKVQVKGLYGQKETLSHGNEGAYKYVAGSVKAGHTYGIYTPYVEGGLEIPVATGNGHGGNDHEKYNARAAVYAYCPRSKVAIDTGINFEYDREWAARTVGYDLEVSYFLTDKVAVSATAGYVLAGQAEGNTDIKGENVGLKLRFAF